MVCFELARELENLGLVMMFHLARYDVPLIQVHRSW